MRKFYLDARLTALLAAWALFWIILYAAWNASVQSNQGHFVYVLDDAYITMAMAKNMVIHGNWGPSPNAFASCASSPLWAWLETAAFYVFGPQQIIPLVMNWLAGTGLIFVAWRILVRQSVAPLACFSVLAAVILLTPMAPVACTGLEHLLHAAMALAMLDVAGRLLSSGMGFQPMAEKHGQDAHATNRLWTALLILTPISTMVRYEQALMVGVIALLFLVRRRYAAAGILVVLAAAPIVIAGAIFVSKGWMFLPTSIALKGNSQAWTSWASFQVFASRGINLLALFPHFSLLLGTLGGLLLLARRPLDRSAGVMATIVLATGLLQAQLASLGWFYRYEAYLVCAGVICAYLLAREIPWQALAGKQESNEWSQLRMAGVLFAGLALAAPLLTRAATAHREIAAASANIGQQQYQMALFLDRYYHGGAVAANDIGAINFLADLDCLDLWGLADVNVARLRIAGHYDSEAIARLAQQRGMKIAVVYDEWYVPYGGVPRAWVKAGEWTIPNNTICGSQTVSFYAVDPQQWEMLHRHLVEFTRDLPPEVEFKIADRCSMGGQTTAIASVTGK